MNAFTMEIKWRNLMALALVVLGLIVFVNALGPIAEMVRSLECSHTRRGGDGDVMGLIAIGIIAISLVAAARILASKS